MTRAPRGFTLVEVIVVLVILAATAAVAAPAFSAASRRGTVDEAASTVMRVFERARAQALTRGAAVTLIIDPSTLRVWQERPDTTFVLSLPGECTLRAEVSRARVAFRADGTAASDVLTLRCGAADVAISADALNGAVRTQGAR